MRDADYDLDWRTQMADKRHEDDDEQGEQKPEKPSTGPTAEPQDDPQNPGGGEVQGPGKTP